MSDAYGFCIRCYFHWSLSTVFSTSNCFLVRNNCLPECKRDNTVLRTRTSIVSHLDQTILHATVERETTVAVLLPSLMVRLSRTVSICMLCVQLGLMRFHIVDCLVDVIPPLSPMVQQPSWSSGQHKFVSYQEEIVSLSCIMQVSHGAQVFNCCLFVHS